jgi:sRNA-binding protein
MTTTNGAGLASAGTESEARKPDRNSQCDLSSTAPIDPKQHHFEAATRTLLRLRQKFPRAFARLDRRKRPPLKIGIFNDLVSTAPDIAPDEIGAALRLYTKHPAYWNCRVVGAKRIDLDGAVCGVVDKNDGRRVKENPTPKRITLDDLREAAARRRSLNGDAP